MEEEEKTGRDHHKGGKHLLKALAEVHNNDRANEVDNENKGQRPNECPEKDGKAANELGVDREGRSKGRDGGSPGGEELLKLQHSLVTENVVLHTPDDEAADEQAEKNDTVFAASAKPIEAEPA